MCDSHRVHVAVIGLGLIGGSVLRALAGDGHHVQGYDADPATRAVARTAAAQAPAAGRWQVSASARDALHGAELAVIAVPLPAVGHILDELAAADYRGLVTDVTSVKTPIQELIDAHPHPDNPTRFVGGHPMAGRESSGFTAADPQLFDGAAWVLCLEPGRTALSDWLAMAALVTSIGARVVPATAGEHDRAVAVVSQVPHLLAAAVAESASEALAGTLAAGSFRDGTRVAASRPSLVAAMCGGNAAAVLPALDTVIKSLEGVRAALSAPDPIAALTPWLIPGHRVRTAWPPRPGASVELPADPARLLELGRAGGWVVAVSADRTTVTAVRPDQP